MTLLSSKRTLWSTVAQHSIKPAVRVPDQPDPNLCCLSSPWTTTTHPICSNTLCDHIRSESSLPVQLPHKVSPKASGSAD